MAKSRSRPKFIPTRREFLGTLFAGAGGAAIGAVLPDFGNEDAPEELFPPKEEFDQLTLRTKLEHRLGGLSIDEDNLERLIIDFENFEAKFDALLIAQGSALTYNVTSQEYFEECLDDRQFQILLIPFMVNYGVFEALHIYNFENYMNEDWKAEIEQEYGLTYIQANLALKTLDNHMRGRGMPDMFLSVAIGVGATLADKLHSHFFDNEPEIPKGPWE